MEKWELKFKRGSYFHANILVFTHKLQLGVLLSDLTKHQNTPHDWDIHFATQMGILCKNKSELSPQ